ncbi:MAG: SLC13 family permease [Magnetococcales bacterium]|nr:SLC13 family permease [Magnetococcales bacterium]
MSKEKAVAAAVGPDDSERKRHVKQIVGALVFGLAAAWLSQVVPSVEVAWVMAILLLTMYLFAFEVVGVDVAAVTIMVLLGMTGLLAPLMGLEKGLVPDTQLFSGFSSNAVTSIIAVMIIGAGLDKTGIMSKVAGVILKIGGTSEKRVIPIISGTVGFISSFMQNIGAAALFLPVVSRISARAGLPMSRLLMPMGFCAILGGTCTMVGSSPLILLNDLILTSNKALPPQHQMEAWSLFSVTPVGLALVATGILYFVLAGGLVLPGSTRKDDPATGSDTMGYFRDVYGVDYELAEMEVPAGSPLVGKRLDDVESQEKIRIIVSVHGHGAIKVGPGSLDRDTAFDSGTLVGVLGSPENLQKFVRKYQLAQRRELETLNEVLASNKSGIAEVVIPPGSKLIGKSARDVWMRKIYGIALVALHRGGKTLREGEGVRDMPLAAGDTLVVHTTWDALARLETDRNFVVVTTEYPHEELRPQKVGWAGVFFGLALFMVLFTDIRLAIALFFGALGMILSGVLTIEEAYKVVSWKSVFLLASLIPLGVAVESTGTAAWIAHQVLAALGTPPTWILQLAVAVLATAFTLVMSNVGATVLLVPLAVNIAVAAGGDPALFALTVAIATSNSFLIPTHQVNALIMGPAGYRVADFMRAGGIMTLLFLVVMMVMLNLVF